MVGGGLNLHGIVRGAVTAVNSDIVLSYKSSSGNTVGAGRKPVPTYATAVDVRANKQPLTFKDLQQLDGVNMNGLKTAFYLFGAVNGVVRITAKGGDLLTDSDGSVWLVVQNLEQWPNWCKVAATLQNGA